MQPSRNKPQLGIFIAMAVNPYGRPVNVGGSHQDASRAQITIGGLIFSHSGILAPKPPVVTAE
jgi:hypothetical protein